MRVIDHVTSPGGRRTNEDRFGHAGNLAWVIDGATDLEADAFLPASSDVQWLVDRVGTCLAETDAEATKSNAEQLLNHLSSRIGLELNALEFPSGRIHPTCSIGLLLVGQNSLHLGRVGDPTLPGLRHGRHGTLHLVLRPP